MIYKFCNCNHQFVILQFEINKILINHKLIHVTLIIKKYLLLSEFVHTDIINQNQLQFTNKTLQNQNTFISTQPIQSLTIMQRSSLIDKKPASNSRAKTPQNKNQTSSNKKKRQTQSLAKTSTNNYISQNSNKKIQQKGSLIQNLKLQAIQQNSFNNRYFFLGKGNNHQMVRKILLRRKNWVQTQNKQDFLNFKWSQSPWGFKYHLLGKSCLCFNHFQYHREISNKMRLVRNMVNYCQSNKLNAFNYIPLTYIIDLTTGQQDMALHGFLKFYNRNLPQSNTQTRMQSIILPRIKHQPYSQTPMNQAKRPQGLFYCQPVMPKTFIAEDTQSQKSPYLWILKPTFMNRGRGVALFNSLQEFQKLIWKYYQGEDLEDYGDRTFNMEDFQDHQQIQQKSIKKEEKSPEAQNKDKQEKVQEKKTQSVKLQNKPTQNKKQSKRLSIDPSTLNSTQPIMSTAHRTEKKLTENNNGLKVFSFVVQKYIESPMLINQRKFDIRVWALLSQNYQVFFFKQGYLRFSSFKYTTKNHSNPFIHLTNNSVQKHANQYDQESGNQMYLSDMKSYMPGKDYDNLQARIRQNIWMSMISARRKINVNGRKQCFQIFGYDFMVDSQFKVWLIEINTNPAIDDCSPMLKAMIPRMLDDGFKLTIDKLFNSKLKQNVQTFSVRNFKDEQNMWQLLGDFKEGINEKTMGRKLSFLRR